MHSRYRILFSQLEANVTLITPNRRMAATLHQLYDQYQIEQGSLTWETPTILPIHTWLQKLWQQTITCTFTKAPLLLTRVQEQYLWEEIIHQSSFPLLRIHETASIIQSAWELLNQWQIDHKNQLFQTTAEYQALQNWIDAYEKLCVQQQYLDMARLPDYLIEKLQVDKIDLPKKLLLLGFSEITPQLKRFLASIKKITQFSLPDFPCITQEEWRIALPQQEDEIYTMARWAKFINTKNPQSSIGCVIGNLDKIRNRVQQIFAEVFSEEGKYNINEISPHFNISAGQSFAHYPIIRLALRLLECHTANFTLDVFGQLLTTPFIGEAEIEKNKRASLDYFLRQNNITKINLPRDLAIVNQFCPLLATRLNQFASACRIITPSILKTHQQWSMTFQNLLTTVGWPGERSLNSAEYQTVEHWLQLLNEFSTLDIVNEKVNFGQAIDQLKQMTLQHTFQTKTPNASIQVLGVLEAAGLPFDYLWLSGMDDTSWPPQPQPNPYIPKNLQRELNLPHSTGARELEYCFQLIKQYKQHCAHLIYSYAEKDNDIEQGPSALIQAIPAINHSQLALPFYIHQTELIFKSKNIETIVDNVGMPVQETERIRGGVNIIKQQALCPFKAYAEWRLFAQEIDQPNLGLRAKERGTIVHKLLEYVWSQIKDQERLLTLESDKLADIITQGIEHALANIKSDLGKHYIALEKKRLFKMLKDWLEIEKQRPFFKVIDHEKKAALNLSGLQLSIKIDRIDELENGDRLLIDYKTSRYNDINAWLEERPHEPQLPLYLLLETKQMKGIAFAQIAVGEYCFKGASETALNFKGVRPIAEIKKMSHLKWSEHIASWEKNLTKLGEEFLKGIAKPDPKHADETCNHCALDGFCRIRERINQ